MCGICNTRTARTTNDLRITAGGHFLVVIVTRGSHDRSIKIVDSGFLFHSNESFKNFRLVSQESLSSSLKERYYLYMFLLNSIREKATLTCQLSSRHLTAITPGVTLLSKSSHAVDGKSKVICCFKI